MASIFQQNPSNPKYVSPTPGEIAIVAGKPNIPAQSMDNALCRQLRECGFNAAAMITTPATIDDSLSNCAENDLKLLVYYQNLFINPKGIIKKFENAPGLGGWILDFDIPKREMIYDSNKRYYLPNVKQNMEETSHPIFIGMSGDWNFDSSGEAMESFPGYIAEIQKLFQPSFWPYRYFANMYPLDDPGRGEAPLERQLCFYKDLQYFAYIARYTATPFWATCKCQSFKIPGEIHAPYPVLARMKGIVFTALAYGAQGIYYWNYRQNPDSADGRIIYDAAPILINGEMESQLWNAVRKINEEIRIFNDIFYGCEMLDCRLFNLPLKLDSLKSLQHAMGPLMTMEVLGGNRDISVLVSHIFNKGKNYLVFVCNPLVTYQTTLNVRLKFNEYWTIKEIYKDGEKLIEENLSDYDTNLSFGVGDYSIFTWE